MFLFQFEGFILYGSVWFHRPGDVFSDPILRGHMILLSSSMTCLTCVCFEMFCILLRVFDLSILVDV